MSLTIHQGDALTVLRTLPDESVHCCVTSPPYWGLRDYGTPGQIGLEPTPGEYVGRLVEVFREVRRVLRRDGTCWLNMGDSYAAQPGQRKETDKAGPKQNTNRGSWAIGSRSCDGLKPKDLCGIPWRLAFALQEDGWWLRSDIVWSKPNPMPESVTDRPTRAHEYIFLLAKSAKYYYDTEAIREVSCTQDPRKPYAPGQVDKRGNGHSRGGGTVRPSLVGTHGTRGHDGNGMRMPDKWDNPLGRNKRSVWTVPTQPTPEAHFATYPIALIEPCILAGCPEGGTILDPFCGAGTTGMAALKHGRCFVGIELNPEYITIANERLHKHMPLFAQVIA